ncbi:MAG: hypothetical protein ABEK02_06050 [Haloquadratum sp.]
MTDEGGSVAIDRLERSDSSDPFDVRLPAGWTASRGDGVTTYANERGDRCVQIVEFSKGLSLYWWVDVYEYDGEWRRCEVGLGESYTDPDAAAAAVESYFDSQVDSGSAGVSGRSSDSIIITGPGDDGSP